MATPAVIPFRSSSEQTEAPPQRPAREASLLDIDREIDEILDLMQAETEAEGEPSIQTRQRFELFCEAFGSKVDRIGSFVRVMEARSQFCRDEAARLTGRARSTENKIDQLKSFLMYFLDSRGITRVEGQSYTIRKQKNSQDSVGIENPSALPLRLSRVELRMEGADFGRVSAALPPELKPLLNRCIQSVTPVSDAVKNAVLAGEDLPGVTLARGSHIRIV